MKGISKLKSDLREIQEKQNGNHRNLVGRESMQSSSSQIAKEKNSGQSDLYPRPVKSSFLEYRNRRVLRHGVKEAKWLRQWSPCRVSGERRVKVGERAKPFEPYHVGSPLASLFGRTVLKRGKGKGN